MTRTEPNPRLDLAYEGRHRRPSSRPSASLMEFRCTRIQILLGSVERLACETPHFSPERWNTHRADAIKEQLAKARYELSELQAGR